MLKWGNETSNFLDSDIRSVTTVSGMLSLGDESD